MISSTGGIKSTIWLLVFNVSYLSFVPLSFFCLLWVNGIFIVYCLLYQFINDVFFKWLLQVQQYTSIIYHSLSSSNIMLLHIQYHKSKGVLVFTLLVCVLLFLYCIIYFTTPCILIFVLNCNYHFK